jgi:GNAT superfamily N-acetyltransferase
MGVLTPAGGVLSVAPDHVDAVRAHLAGGGERVVLPAVIGRPQGRWIEGMYRYSTAPTDLPDGGEWYPADSPPVPPWLRVFGGEALLALHDGVYVAGVGLKRHDAYGWEIAVGTEPASRGRGLARRLVAQAARTVLAMGAVPTYLHAFDNVASGHVAEAAGFPDRGWRTVAVFDGQP